MLSDRERHAAGYVVQLGNAVKTYLEGLDGDDFLVDRRTSDATERCLIRISNALDRLPDSFEPTAAFAESARRLSRIAQDLRHQTRPSLSSQVYEVAMTAVPPLRDAAARALAR